MHHALPQCASRIRRSVAAHHYPALPGTAPGRQALVTRTLTHIETLSNSTIALMLLGLGVRVQRLGFRVYGSGFRVQGLGFMVQGSVFRVSSFTPSTFAVARDVCASARQVPPALAHRRPVRERQFLGARDGCTRAGSRNGFVTLPPHVYVSDTTHSCTHSTYLMQRCRASQVLHLTRALILNRKI